MAAEIDLFSQEIKRNLHANKFNANLNKNNYLFLCTGVCIFGYRKNSFRIVIENLSERKIERLNCQISVARRRFLTFVFFFIVYIILRFI